MITCQTPYIDITGSDETKARYGVELDNIRNYTRFSTELLIVPDPNVTSGHQNEFRNMFDSIITIKVIQRDSLRQTTEMMYICL